MIRVGLTGGIGSGKSLVARHFEAHGACCVDADQLARAVVSPGSPALQSIAQAFGPTMLLPEGALDRPALAARVFSDPQARTTLEAITHPLIAAAAEQSAKDADRAGFKLWVYEAALLVERGRGRLDAFDALVVVKAPVLLRLSRVQARDGLSLKEVRARISAQGSLEAQLAVADFVVDNGGDPEETREQVDQILQVLEPH